MHGEKNQKVKIGGININYLHGAASIWHLILHLFMSLGKSLIPSLQHVSGAWLGEGGVAIKDRAMLRSPTSEAKIISKVALLLLPSYLMMYISHAGLNPNYIL